jgi:hypothetical protein
MIAIGLPLLIFIAGSGFCAGLIVGMIVMIITSDGLL